MPNIVEVKSHLKSRFLIWPIFLAALAVALMNLISVIFPAFFVRTFGGFADYAGINNFETGIWTYPLLMTDAIVFTIAILFFKNKLPHIITRSIKFIFDFEISAGMAFIVVTMMIGIYAVFAVSGTFIEDPWEDYQPVKHSITHWSIAGGKGLLDFKYFLLHLSFYYLTNVRAIPFIASIALVILTYLVTMKIAKKRFAGIVAISIVLSSHIFLLYSTTATYPNFWIMSYLLSLYLIYRKWQLSAISYILSFLEKGLTLTYLPLSFFFIYKAEISKGKKIGTVVSYGVVILILVVIALNPATSKLFHPINFNYHNFIDGFAALSIQMRSDGLILLFLVPLVVGLFVASRHQIRGADSLLVLIFGIMMSSPLLYGLTNITIQPYRFIALIVFFAIGTGCLLSKNHETGLSIVKTVREESPGNTG